MKNLQNIISAKHNISKNHDLFYLKIFKRIDKILNLFWNIFENLYFSWEYFCRFFTEFSRVTGKLHFRQSPPMKSSHKPNYLSFYTVGMKKSFIHKYADVQWRSPWGDPCLPVALLMMYPLLNFTRGLAAHWNPLGAPAECTFWPPPPKKKCLAVIRIITHGA